MRPTAIIIFLLLLVLAVGLGFQIFRPNSVASSHQINWTLSKLDGSSAKLDDYSGSVKLVNFWASWCGTCRQEMPDIVDIFHQFKGQKFTVLAVNYDEDSATAKQFATSYGMDFPVFLDPGKAVASRYQVVTMPSSYLLDKNGAIVRTYIGQIDSAQVKKDINTYLSQ